MTIVDGDTDNEQTITDRGTDNQWTITCTCNIESNTTTFAFGQCGKIEIELTHEYVQLFNILILRVVQTLLNMKVIPYL